MILQNQLEKWIRIVFMYIYEWAYSQLKLEEFQFKSLHSDLYTCFNFFSQNFAVIELDRLEGLLYGFSSHWKHLIYYNVHYSNIIL
jgi:hypothetical protein